MAAVVVRRTLATATVAGLVLLGSPLVGSALAATPPTLTSSSPTDGAAVGSGNLTVSATYNEAIDPASTVTLTNINNNVASGSTSFSASSFNGPTDTIKFTPAHTLPNGSYVAHIHADAKGDTSAFTDTIINFTVNDTLPPAAPTVSVAGFNRSGTTTHWINGGNQKAVPFAGTAPAGFRVGVLVYNKNAPDPIKGVGSGPSDKSANTAVTDCGSSTCPWQLAVDTTNTPDTAYQYYVYTYSAAGKVPAALDQNNDPTITKDTTAPAPGQSATGSLSGNTLTVSDGNDPDSSVTFWNVVVTDSVGGTVEKDDIPASNATGRGFSTTVNVQPLVDGPLTVDTYASDDAGNLSSKDEPTPNNAPSDKETVNLAIDSADSFVTVHGDNVPFSQVAGQRIALPQSITLKFNEPIRSAVVDTAPPNSSSSPKTLFSANLCLADNTGFCVATAKPVALTQDQEGLVLTPAGGASSPKPGVYSIRRVTAPAATQGSCPDRSVSNMLTTTDQSIVTNCERVDTGNGVRGTDPVLTFTIDDIAPTPTFTAFSPSLVTGATVHNVSISGTTDADTARVQLLIKSSGGGTPKLINVPVTPPSDPNAATVGWSVSSVDLSTLPDGSLTVSATATDLAGNVTPNPVVLSPAPTLAAHLSWLTESTSSRQVTYGKLIRLAGRLTDNSGVGIANAALSIKPQFDNGKFGSAFGTTTDANGYWAMLVGPTQNATYWASYAGSSTGAFHDAVTVHTARTLVLARIFFLSPRYGAKVKSPVVLKGQVSPNKAGKYVYFYRHTKTHNYYLGRAKLGRSSRWAFKLSLRRGTTYVFAKIGNTYGNRGNRTGYLKLRH